MEASWGSRAPRCKRACDVSRPCYRDGRVSPSPGAPRWDPYLVQPRGAGKPTYAPLAIVALVVALLGPVSVIGPAGAVAAVLLGIFARRTVERGGPTLRGRGLANGAIALGALGVVGWAGVGVMALSQHPEVISRSPLGPMLAPANAPPAIAAPSDTRITKVGKITVVDVGASVVSLEGELVRQVFDATREGERVLLMTTDGGCEPCRGVDASLPDAVMQEALDKVRLVRVDIPTFFEALDDLGIFYDRYPGYFLLGADGRPSDGIDGGEWGEDIPANIAPVLGPFLRGDYPHRRTPWVPEKRGLTL